MLDINNILENLETDEFKIMVDNSLAIDEKKKLMGYLKLQIGEPLADFF
jgi:hypothetical protein